MSSEPRERPILFSGPMVRALLAGTKTQTRRIVKPQPSDYQPGPLKHEPKHPGPYFDAYNGGPHWCWWSADNRQGPDWIRCPYGKPGDRLWVREAWTKVPATAYRMSEGVEQIINPADPDEAAIYCAGWDRSIPKWKPSIHMPRWASRITLELTVVRVERLHQISEEDALAEGVQLYADGFHWEPNAGWPGEPKGSESVRVTGRTAVHAYLALWEKINGRESVIANPWVWAISFRRVTP